LPATAGPASHAPESPRRISPSRCPHPHPWPGYRQCCQASRRDPPGRGCAGFGDARSWTLPPASYRGHAVTHWRRLAMRAIGNEVNDGRLRRWRGQQSRSGLNGCQPGCRTFVLHASSTRAHGSGGSWPTASLPAQVVIRVGRRSAPGPQITPSQTRYPVWATVCFQGLRGAKLLVIARF
jgi:hypothetical protein